jgi:hypothetical protein
MADMREKRLRAQFGLKVEMLDAFFFRVFVLAQFSWLGAVGAIYAVTFDKFFYVSATWCVVGGSIMIGAWMHITLSIQQIKSGYYMAPDQISTHGQPISHGEVDLERV